MYIIELIIVYNIFKMSEANNPLRHVTLVVTTAKRSEFGQVAKLSTATDLPRDQFLYHQIFDAILAHRLLPGTKLTEDKLARIFGVSRTVVRSALTRLSHDRIVEMRPNRGAFVARPSVDQAREILAARCLVESAIVRDAVANATSTGIDDLRTLVREEQDNFEHDKRGSGIRLSGDFHIKLALLSGNSTLTEFVKVLVPQTSLIIAQYEKPDYTTCSHKEHFELIDVIESGNEEQAVTLMEEHLRKIKNKLDLTSSERENDLQNVFADIISLKDKKR